MTKRTRRTEHSHSERVLLFVNPSYSEACVPRVTFLNALTLGAPRQSSFSGTGTPFCSPHRLPRQNLT